jgi:hypothetical protein
MTPKPEPQRCTTTIDGPKVGAHVVLWRKQCRNRTRHPSGKCYVHRTTGWYVGKPAEDQ